MSLELLVLTLDDVLIRADDPRKSGFDAAPRERDALLRWHEDACTEARAGQSIRIRGQALQLMRSAELDGVRLALAAPISSRKLRVLLDGAIGPDWMDRFAVIATADALSPRETEIELYRLILHTADVPAHRALLVGATQSSLRAAQAVGMHTATVRPAYDDAPRQAGGSTVLCGSPDAVWPDFHALECSVAGQRQPDAHAATRQQPRSFP
ncbi:HAD family hydrolase [Cupriavidus sp. CuC1]|uniref:hypothetical protein n=1 Tax=Cupriavidus sp. CuC1 TaxID=3373131 RepID=UPI0037CF7AE0